MYGKTVPPELVEKRIAPQRGQKRPSISGENNPAKRPDVRAKISENNAMKSPEVRKKFQGENHPMYGKHHSPESIDLMSRNRKGKAAGEQSAAKRPEVREKIRQSKLGVLRPDMMGENNPMHDPVVKSKVSSNCSMKRPEVALKNAIARLHQSRPTVKGPNHPNWKGGTSPQPYCKKWTPNLRERIRAYFGNMCIVCGKTEEENGRKLCCHHVYDNKDACCDHSPPVFALLCNSCHAKITWDDSDRWQRMLSFIIDEMYDGKSYFTKDDVTRSLTQCRK